MNDEKWLDDFLTSFETKEPEEEFIHKVKLEVKKELQTVADSSLILPKSFWAYVLFIFIATLPLFSIVNYFYYISLKYMVSTFFPQLMTLLLAIFICSVTLIGSLCYAAIPIWAALHLRHAK